MRIEIRGRNFKVTDELRRQVADGLGRLDRLVPLYARCEIVLSEERNPSIEDRFGAEATLHTKGVTLHAHEASSDMTRTVSSVLDDIRRQVIKRREKQRKRSETRRLVNQIEGRFPGGASARP
jgi:putative sigma-54 modulation protein